MFLFWLLLAAIPFVLPIATWVAAQRTRARVDELLRTIRDQQRAIDLLTEQVGQLKQEGRAVPAAAREAAPRTTEPTTPAVRPASPLVVRPQSPPAEPAMPAASQVVPSAPEAAPRENPWPELPRQPPKPPVAPPVPPVAPRENPWPELARKETPPAVSVPSAPTPAALSASRESSTSARSASTITAGVSADGRRAAPPLHPPPRRPPVAAGPPPPSMDLESFVGVKLFSAIAGIALVLAAIFFLRYSVEHGWLQPPMRVLIGISVGVSLVVVCELKAARRYPVTANALDAAAVAILFATFFAAHALWNLIPSAATFVLLGIVTAVAVLLSIRRESLFIAVLGLLGGFATPALLSTGENQPIPLFAYLMLLNIGLAWVAYRQTWPILTALTLVLTAVYQWFWVFSFLDAASLTLGMGVFAIFPLVAFAGLVIARPQAPPEGGPAAGVMFEYTAVTAAAMPLVFAVYLSTVPAYGEHPGLLFGFLLLVDGGLLAVAMARRHALLHAAGAMTTLLVMACWLAFSYTPGAYVPALGFCAVFVTFFAAAGPVATMLRRPLAETGADVAAPLLLFVPAVLARAEPAFVNPLPLFATLLVLVLLIAWRAIAGRAGALYFIAAFFAIATQAVWSSTHLSVDVLRIAVAVYAIFGIIATAIPVTARRIGRPLEPAGGGGFVLIASLVLLLFLSLGPVSPTVLWALALLLAILNAGLFIESGSAGLPAVSVAGSLVSWMVLASWWLRAGAAVGVVPSLAVLIGLTLVTFAGHAWVNRSGPSESGGASRFGEGLYLGLVGHLFLFFVAINPAWSIPPAPVLGTLAVLTLAASAVSLATRKPVLHVAGVVAAGAIIAAWTNSAGADWAAVGLAASAVASLFGLLWMPIDRTASARQAAAALLFLSELTAMLATRSGSPMPFAIIVVTHVANLGILLSLTWIERWRGVALWGVFVACCAAAVQWQAADLSVGWSRLLILTSAMYAVFMTYPFALGRRAQADRDPYFAAVLASAMLFVAARAALTAGGYGWIVGALPVAEGGVMAVLLRQLLRIEAPGARDLGRLALVAGTALAFVTVAIPLQLHRQWITMGWALEGAALAWLFRRIQHRGLQYWALTLFGAVFVRLAMNPEILFYEPRGALRIFNWYLYAYLVCAAAFLLAGWWLAPSASSDRRTDPAPSQWLAAGAVILLFLLLNIEIADFFATGPTIMFRFGATVSQDLTYTIGWLAFGLGLLAACIYRHNRFGRVAAVTLIALTTFKCFLYDLGSLEGLYRVASFVGLALSLALVSLALQKFVLVKPEGRA